MFDSTTDPLAEITAMKSLAEAVAGLDPEARTRVLRWAADRFKVAGAQPGKTQTETREGHGGRDRPAPADRGDAPRFSNLADLWAAASPSTDSDRALIGGYWFHVGVGQEDFGSFEVHSELKNLGHPLANITTAFDRLKAQKPALVMQVKKSGSSKQARKRYKLTGAGKTAVEQLIGHQE